MSKNGSQCKIGNRETKALAKALESSYPINEHTILAKIESFQTYYDKDSMYVPTEVEMKAFLELQAKEDLIVPKSQISNLEKQVKEGTATMQKIKGTIYIATESGMIVKVLPNKTMVITNPSDTSEEGIALHQAFDTFFSQTDEAGSEKEKETIPGIELKEDTERSYLSRTRQNAEWSDITIALGEDLNTTGELQTAKLAGAEVVEEERTNARGEKYTTVTKVTNPKKGKYVGINLNTISSAEAIAMEIYNQIIERNLPTDNIKLNIAGNGIYTLKSGQASYDKLLTEVLKALQDKGITISEVRSGGQSGIDEAGIKAAVSLGLKASILAPKGYRFRDKDNKDISNKELFIKRFNPDYKEPKKAQRKKAEVLYEDEEITEAKKKAKEFTLISSTQLGANSAWKIAGENYGIEAIHMSNVKTYDDLSAEERASLELPYHNAMVALKRSEIKLTNASANAATIRVGKLGRMLHSQVKESDGIFIISELVDAGANAHSFVQGKQGRKNEAKFAVAAGSLNSIATYHAMQMKKPLHVYDEFRDSWMTYDYTKEE